MYKMYNFKTTFLEDFYVANKFGHEAILDTYNNAFDKWHENVIYVTELSLVLNWNIFHYYDLDRETAQLYDMLWRQCDEWCINNLTGDDLDYYLKTTD